MNIPMLDHWLAVGVGFCAGLLTGWFSLLVISACAVSGRISQSEEERDSEGYDDHPHG